MTRITLRYDDAANRIYVGFGEGGIAIINAARRKTNRCDQTFRASGSVRVGNESDRESLLTLPNRRLVAVIDRGKGAVVSSWPPGSALANFPDGPRRNESSSDDWLSIALKADRAEQ